jgi:ribonuclease BN (tRNA processing enzyme)
LGEDLDTADGSWISGHALAAGASLLIHDCQYEEAEYRERQGWGHSSVSDAMSFARRADCQRALMFHHDPGHDDRHLEGLGERIQAEWRGAGSIGLARDGQIIDFQN